MIPVCYISHSPCAIDCPPSHKRCVVFAFREYLYTVLSVRVNFAARINPKYRGQLTGPPFYELICDPNPSSASSSF